MYRYTHVYKMMLYLCYGYVCGCVVNVAPQTKKHGFTCGEKGNDWGWGWGPKIPSPLSVMLSLKKIIMS